MRSRRPAPAVAGPTVGRSEPAPPRSTLEGLLRLTDDLLAVITTEGWFVELSDAWAALLDRSSSRIRSRPLTELLLPEDRPAAREALGRLRRGAARVSFDARVACSNGERCLLRWTAVADATPGLVCVVARNLTLLEQHGPLAALRAELPDRHDLDVEVAPPDLAPPDLAPPDLAPPTGVGPATVPDPDRRFRDLIELSEEGIAEFDADGRIRFANQRLARMLRSTPDDLLGSSAFDHLDERGAARGRSWLAGAAPEHGDVGRTTLRVLRADGSWLWGQIAARTSRDPAGRVRRLTVVVTDVTAHKQREQELDEARARLEDAQGLAELGYWQADLATGALHWSPLVYDLFGVEPTLFEPTVSRFLDAVHPADRARLTADATRTGAPGVHESVHRILRPDGEVRVVRAVARGEPDEHGTLRWLSGTIQDLTETKRTELALRESESLLHRVLAATNDGWWDADLCTGAAFHSDRWWEIHGYEPGALPEHPDLWRLLTHPEDLPRIDATFLTIIEEGLPTFTLTGRVLRKDGSSLPVVVRGLVDYDPDGRPIRISGVTTDVTEQQRAEAIKDEFISVVSHELRTPLTAIGGALELIDSGAAGAVPAPMTTLLDVARRNTVRLRALIDDLLDIERLASGHTSFKVRSQPLDAIVTRALADNAPLAESHQVSFSLACSVGAVEVAVDGNRLQQVLANLLSNAVKFAPAGSTVDVRLRTTDGCVRTEVVDHGPGVPPELGESVFDRFVQADPCDPRSRGGTGLGLAISREIVERLGGQIGYDSVPGRTCFWFDLPTPT